MHVEVTRMITAWLGHATYGVNALVPGIPRDLIGGEEEDEEPKPVTIYNDIDFELDDVGGFQPAKVPALAVICDVNPEGTDISQMEKSAHQYGVTGAVAYYSEYGEGARAKARRHGNYVLRAVGQSLVRFNKPRLSKDYRELNAVALVRLTKLSIQRVAGAVPASSLMGIAFFDGTILNKAP